MGSWAIIVPEAATNIVTNPSAETNTTGYTAGAGTLARDTTRQMFGYYSLKYTPTAATSDGFYYAITLIAATQYTITVYVYDVATVLYKLRLYDVTGAVDKGSTTWTGTGTGWTRKTLTVTTGANTSHRIYVEKNVDASVGAYYADALQCEAAGYETTYVDGDQSGCAWTSTVHGSTATRSAQSRAGGRVRDLDVVYGVKTTMQSGGGMPALTHNVTRRALLPGAVLQSVKVEPRELTLSLAVKGTTWANLHTLRKALEAVLKTDRVAPLQPVLLQYTGSGGDTVQIAAHYAGGMGGDQQANAGYFERIALRFVAYDPYFYAIGESATTLTTKGAPTFYHAQRRTVGPTASSSVWSGTVDTLSADGTVRAIAVDVARGIVYFAGNLRYWTGVTSYYHAVAKWDGTTFSYLAAGNPLTSSTISSTTEVRSITLDAAGNLYVGGTFSAGLEGVADTAFIAKWNGSAWVSVGTGGADLDVSALATGLDGTIYAAGRFTTIGGVAATLIAKYNGSAWSALGTGLNGTGEALAIGVDGSPYVGGQFTTANGVSCVRIARWTGSTFAALGSGCDNTVQTVAVAPDGSLYVGGSFTTAGGVACTRVAKWNGTAFTALGTGMNNTVHRLIASSTLLYAAGIFTSAGGLTLTDRMAVWNGSTWAHLDLDLPGTPIVYDFGFLREFIYSGTSIILGTAGQSGYATTVTNGGTTVVYPRVVLKRSGGTSATLTYLKNETTGAILYLNYALLDGETLTIDLRPGQKKLTSSLFGDVTSQALLRNSNVATWWLQPGANTISLFVNDAGTPTMTAYAIWQDAHWGWDGTAA